MKQLTPRLRLQKVPKLRTRRKTYRRGRTRPGRMNLLDQFLGTEPIPLPGGNDAVVVDVGYGDDPVTTFELHELLLEIFDEVRTIGVEADKSRVEKAREEGPEEIEFTLGGFDLKSIGIQHASLVRCFNVLRGYGIWDVKKALLQMSAALVPGGLLIEGTTDVEGTLLCCHIWRRRETTMEYDGLLCATDFSRGFSPMMFRDVFPRDIRRHGHPGEPTFDWLSAWNNLVLELRQEAQPEAPEESADDVNRRLFEESAKKLAEKDPRTDAALAAHGALLFRPERPSTRPEVLSPDDAIEQQQAGHPEKGSLERSVVAGGQSPTET